MFSVVIVNNSQKYVHKYIQANNEIGNEKERIPSIHIICWHPKEKKNINLSNKMQHSFKFIHFINKDTECIICEFLKNMTCSE